MGTITLTNIPQFIEQPGRNIATHAGSLDRMTVPFLGPYYLPVPFAKGSPDTVYPLMFCTGYTEKDNGALKELSVEYSGRTDAKGGKFVSELLLSNSSSEKELSYSELDSGLVYYQPQVVQTATGPMTVTAEQYKTSTVNYVLRYISTTVSYKYCCYPAPYVMPSGQVVGDKATNPIVTSQYIRFSGAGSATYSSGPPNGAFLASQYPGPFGYVGPIIRETAFSATELVGGWYDCSVTYDARYEI